MLIPLIAVSGYNCSIVRSNFIRCLIFKVHFTAGAHVGADVPGGFGAAPGLRPLPGGWKHPLQIRGGFRALTSKNPVSGQSRSLCSLL